MQKLILIALLGFVFIAITGAETEENSFDVIEAEVLEIRKVRAPPKNGNKDDNGENTDKNDDEKPNRMPKKKNKQAIKDNNDDDKPNRMPKKKNKQAKPDNVNSEGKGKGNSNDNDNDEDDKKNPDRGAKKKNRQAKKDQENGQSDKGRGKDNNNEGKQAENNGPSKSKSDKKADRTERRRKLVNARQQNSNKKGKDNSNKDDEGKGKNGKDEGNPIEEDKIPRGNDGSRQRQGKKAGKDQGKDGGKEEKENVDSSNLGKSKDKIKTRTDKKKPTETNRQTTCPVSDLCVTTAVNYLRIVQNQVANFKNQKARIDRQNITGTRKNEKKDVFAAANNRLVEFAGGNKTAPNCGTQTTGAGVDNIKNLTDTLTKCSDNIKAACDISALPQPNKTFVDDCTKKTEAFEAGVEACRSKTGAEACKCWTAPALGADIATIKACSLAEDAKAMATAVTTCKSAFSNCRKYEDDVAGAIHGCSVNPTGLIVKLKSLAANTDAVTKAKDKINAIINSRQMVSRQAAASCAEIVSKAAELIKILNDAPASPKIIGLANSISTSTVVCSAAEKTSLKTTATQLVSALEVIAAEVVAAQATLQAVTGTTASASAIQAAPSCSTDTCAAPPISDSTVAPTTTTPAPTTTKAPTGRRRRQVVEDILKSKLL